MPKSSNLGEVVLVEQAESKSPEPPMREDTASQHVPIRPVNRRNKPVIIRPYSGKISLRERIGLSTSSMQLKAAGPGTHYTKSSIASTRNLLAQKIGSDMTFEIDKSQEVVKLPSNLGASILSPSCRRPMSSQPSRAHVMSALPSSTTVHRSIAALNADLGKPIPEHTESPTESPQKQASKPPSITLAPRDIGYFERQPASGF